MTKILGAAVVAAAFLSVAACGSGTGTTVSGPAIPATVTSGGPPPSSSAPVAATGSPSPASSPSRAPEPKAAPVADPTPAPLNFWNYGYVSAVDAVNGAVTIDVVQHFGGAEAQQACKQDGVRPSGAWCTNYYIRNTNPLKRTVPLASYAEITMVTSVSTGLDTATPATIAQVKAQVDREHRSLYRFYVDGGRITQLQAVYTP